MMTSGMTSGEDNMALNKVRPRKLPKRTSAKAASVASTVPRVALIKATFKDSEKPSTSRESFHSAWYQRSEKPVNTLSWRVLLKENTTKNNSGR